MNLSPKDNLPEAAMLNSVEALWGLPLQVAGCQNCQQAHLVNHAQVGGECPYCGVGRLDPQPARLRSEPPERIMPVKVDPTRLQSILSNFVKPVWLHPVDLTPHALMRRSQLVFWPAWLVDSDLNGDWQAEMGYDYQVKSSQESFSGGNWRTHEIIETRIRWEPRLGQIQRRFENIPAPALSDTGQLGALLSDYPLHKAQAYQPESIRQACLRIPDQGPEEVNASARRGLDRAAAEACRTAASAHHVRNFSVQAEYDRQNWTQLLLPIYTTWYTADDGRRQMLFINGDSGKVIGKRLASQHQGWMWGGVCALLALSLFFLGIIAGALIQFEPRLTFLSMLLILCGLGTSTFSILLAVWPWQWNRRQAEARVIQR